MDRTSVADHPMELATEAKMITRGDGFTHVLRSLAVQRMLVRQQW